MVKKTGNKEAEALKALMHREAGDVIRKRIAEYLRCMKEGQSSGPNLLCVVLVFVCV